MASAFRLEITARAERDVQAVRDFIALDKKRAADKWQRGCERHVFSLAFFPERFETIPEAEEIGDHNLRHALFGSYRIVYRVQDDRVTVLRVIHSSRILDLGSLG